MALFSFPLLLVPFAIYNIIAFLTPGVGFTSPITSVQMASGSVWSMTAGDMLIAFAVIMLFVELLKATRTGARNVVDHGLSLLLFIVMGVEFILVAQAATSTFFLLRVIGFVDVLGGFAVTLRSAQRDLTIDTLAR
jgi:uncharacterized membrane protein